MCYTKFRRFDRPAFLRASETSQTNRLERTYTVVQAAAAQQRRASLVGDGAKWRITNFKQVARAIANCSYRISDR